MLWTLLIWAVIGFASHYVWTLMVLVRAVRNGYDTDLYFEAMNAVSDEHDAWAKNKYKPVVRIILITVHNLLWPYKLIWLTRDYVPEFDERYENLILEKLEKGESA